MNPGATRDAYVAVGKAGIGFKNKKCHEGQRKSLKRRDLVKEI